MIDNEEKIKDKKSKKNVRNVIVRASNENKNKKNEGQVVDKYESHLLFEEFVQRRFNCILQRLKYCNLHLCTNLLTSFISLEVVKKMKLALICSHLQKNCYGTVADKGMEQVSEENDQRFGHLMKSSFVRDDFLQILRTIPKKSLFHILDMSGRLKNSAQKIHVYISALYQALLNCMK